VTSTLLQTPLNAAHRRLGARMVDFAGWDMPVQYPTGILAEHRAVRARVGVFDLSHMGRVVLRGPDAVRLAQWCATRDLAGVRAGEAAYSLLCLDDGGILDDVIAYRRGPDEVLFVFNASNRLVDTKHMLDQQRRLGLTVDVDDRTLGTALMGVQGPAAQATLQPLCDVDLDLLAGYSFVDARLDHTPVLVSRTGYTGEDGFELMVDAARAEAIWDVVLAQPTQPLACGLGARDTLRTEAGFALYGHEIDRTTSPFEARLGWVVNLDKADFVGREALARQKAAGVERRLVGLSVGAGGVPRPDAPVVDDGVPVGQVTSGTHSPTLQHGIALAYVPIALASVGQRLAVEVRGRARPAEVTRLPFVAHHSRPRAQS
jgi:aminomethyltransferase